MSDSRIGFHRFRKFVFPVIRRTNLSEKQTKTEKVYFGYAIYGTWLFGLLSMWFEVIFQKSDEFHTGWVGWCRGFLIRAGPGSCWCRCCQLSLGLETHIKHRRKSILDLEFNFCFFQRCLRFFLCSVFSVLLFFQLFHSFLNLFPRKRIQQYKGYVETQQLIHDVKVCAKNSQSLLSCATQRNK